MAQHRPRQAVSQLLLQIHLAITACSLLPSSAGAYTAAAPPVPCLPDQAAALLRLKRSFVATDYSTIAFRSWRAGTDCCRWTGVRCGHFDGRVTSLDLGYRGLKSGGLEPALFDLTSLRYLNLGSNDFNGSQLPFTGFEQLAELTHLNLSSSSFSGKVPNGIGHLTNLISLDLSTSFELSETLRYKPMISAPSVSRFIRLDEENLERLIAKLNKLRELNLGSVDLSSSESHWCSIITKSCPKLRVLRLPNCQISGPICGSFHTLLSLVVYVAPIRIGISVSA